MILMKIPSPTIDVSMAMKLKRRNFERFSIALRIWASSNAAPTCKPLDSTINSWSDHFASTSMSAIV